MSSVQSVIAQAKRNPTKIFTPTTASYTDSVIGENMPIPFYVTKQGVLEIRVQDGVQADLLTVGTFVGLNSDVEFQCKVMGGVMPVSSLGQTVKDFLTAWIEEDENSSPSGEFELVVAPVMTKVQFSTNPDQFGEEQTATLSDYPPSSSEYVTGLPSDVYRTVCVFQSPMTVKYYSVALSKFRYASLTSTLDSI
jgi:hypothetical protein